jgi:uncharacterized protein YndB with AHSA1/START domain
METTHKTTITVQATIDAPIEKVWKCWTDPADIVKWNSASDEWHTTKSTNDLRAGGKFSSRMEAKDGSFGFDFEGEYDAVIVNKYIEYTLADDRKVKVQFTADGSKTEVSETFEAETENPIALQREGWQAIMNNFKKYIETK